ncbi:MAG: hypothetical protein DRJ67_12130, partial [Thermoprotei archaeon]
MPERRGEGTAQLRLLVRGIVEEVLSHVDERIRQLSARVEELERRMHQLEGYVDSVYGKTFQVGLSTAIREAFR